MGTAAGIGRSPSPASSWITCVDIGAVAAGAVILGLALVPLLAEPWGLAMGGAPPRRRRRPVRRLTVPTDGERAASRRQVDRRHDRMPWCYSSVLLLERGNTQGDSNHAHPVWRDPGADFGLDVLARHRAALHH